MKLLKLLPKKGVHFSLITISIFLFSFTSKATHIAGMDLTYKYISGTTYQLTAVYYRDCAGQSAPTSVSVYYKSVSGNVNKSVTIYPIANTGKTITNACGTTTSICDGGTQPGIQKWEYRGNITLGSNRADWEFSTEFCCRNNAINTIASPGNTGTSVITKLNNIIAPTNSSPFFSNDPFAFICINQNATYNHGVIDLDGDSLSYSFVMPKTSAGNSAIIYNTPYTFSNPLSSSTPITLDPITGNINMTPNLLQITIMAVQVKEYRAGVLIGSVIRDMELWVTNCGANSLPVATGVNGSSLYSANACVGQQTCFDILTTDINTSQNLTLTWNNGIAGATFTQSPGSRPTGHFCWTPTAANVGTNVFTVIVKDDACPNNGLQVFSYNILVTGANVTPGSPLTLSCNTNSGTISASSTTTGATYNWSGTGIVSGGNTSAPTVNAAGTYIVTVTNPASGCTSTASVLVSNNTVLPNVSVSNNLTLDCSTTSGAITVNSTTPGVTYAWQGPGVVSGAANNSATVNATGTYTVTVTNPSTGCTRTATVSVTSNITPPVITAGNPITLTCTNSNGIITASSSISGGAYVWQGPGIVSGGNSSSPIVNAAGTYTVSVTNATNGCTGTATVTVTSNTLVPNVVAGNSITLTCANTNGTITANSSTSGATYNWLGSGIVAGGNTASPTVNAAGTYTVIVTNPSSGCTSTASISVITNTIQPNVTGGNPLTLTCTTNSGTITANSTTAGVTYNWLGNAVVSGGTTATPTVSSVGTYTVVVTNPVSGCTNTATVIVNSNAALPTITLGNAVTLTCTDASGLLTVSSTTAGAIYAWQGPGIVSGAGTSSAIVNAIGTYTVTVTNPTSGCTSTATTVVNTNTTIPDVTVGNPLTLTCADTNGVINVSSTTAGVTYTWQGAGIVSGGNTSSPVVNATGTYTVTVTNPTSGCTSTSTMIVNSNTTLPNVSVGNPLILTCINTNGIINASSTTAGATYVWQGANIVSGGTSASPTVNAAGTYTVTVTNPTTGCTKTATVIVTGSSTPPNVTAGNPLTLTCGTTSGVINASSTTAGVTYNWSGPSIVSGDTTSSPTVDAAGTYTVTVTNATTGCTSTATVVVTGNVLLPNVTFGNSLTLTCLTTSGTISVSSTTSGVTYAWSGPGIVSGSNLTSPVVNVPGTYTVIVTDPTSGCTTTTTIPVNSNTVPPVITAGNSIMLTCIAGNNTVFASSTTPNVTYSWSGAGIVSDGNTSSPTINAAGTYTVTITDPITGCTNTDIVIVSPNIPPTAIVSADITITEGDSTLLNATGGTTYTWYPSAGLSCANCANPVATPLQSTTYCVAVTDVNGCSDSACVKIDVSDLCPQGQEFIVPNVFSPNGDEQNDYFFVDSWNDICVEKISIFIYNRWGQRVFQSDTVNMRWDGRTESGIASPEETYFYIITLKKRKSDEKIYKGSLTLIR